MLNGCGIEIFKFVILLGHNKKNPQTNGSILQEMRLVSFPLSCCLWFFSGREADVAPERQLVRVAGMTH